MGGVGLSMQGVRYQAFGSVASGGKNLKDTGIGGNTKPLAA
jgi:hypothetical protein